MTAVEAASKVCHRGHESAFGANAAPRKMTPLSAAPRKRTRGLLRAARLALGARFSFSMDGVWKVFGGSVNKKRFTISWVLSFGLAGR